MLTFIIKTIFMKNLNQIFNVFLTSILVILFFVGCNSTGNIEGVYEKYKRNDDSTYDYVQDIEFQKGKFKPANVSQWGEKLTYEIINEDSIVLSEENQYGFFSRQKFRIIRDSNNKVIKFAPAPNVLVYYKKKE